MMVSSVVIFEMYAASYTAFLAVVKLAVPFDSFLTMYKDTDYTIGSSVGTTYKQFVLAVSGGEVKNYSFVCSQEAPRWRSLWRSGGRMSAGRRRESRK